MPRINYNYLVLRGDAALKVISGNANMIRDASTLSFDTLSSLAQAMRSSNQIDLAPLVAGTEAQSNTIINRFATGWTANPFQAITLVRSTLQDFLLECRTMINSIPDPVSIDANGDTIYAAVDVTPLHPSLDALLAALAPLE